MLAVHSERSMVKAIIHMMTQTRQSRIRQAFAVVNRGASNRPPKLRLRNQSVEAHTAPAQKATAAAPINLLLTLPSKNTVSRYT